jgi:hypothetical protein
MSRVHQFGFVMFRPRVQELVLNIEQFSQNQNQTF